MVVLKLRLTILLFDMFYIFLFLFHAFSLQLCFSHTLIDAHTLTYCRRHPKAPVENLLHGSNSLFFSFSSFLSLSLILPLFLSFSLNYNLPPFLFCFSLSPSQRFFFLLVQKNGSFWLKLALPRLHYQKGEVVEG